MKSIYLILLISLFSKQIFSQAKHTEILPKGKVQNKGENLIIGSWKVIDMVEEENNLTLSQNNYRIIRRENDQIIKLIGEVIFSFEQNRRFTHKVNGKIDYNGTYTIKNNKLNLNNVEKERSFIERITFELVNDQLTLIIPENSDTLVLFLKKLK